MNRQLWVDDQLESQRLWETVRTATQTVESANASCGHLARTTLQASVEDLLCAVEDSADPCIRAAADVVRGELDVLATKTADAAAAVLALADAAVHAWAHPSALPRGSEDTTVPAF